MSQQQSSTDEYRLQGSTDAYGRAWQLGYRCCKPHDHAKGDAFLELIDTLPQQLHKAALDGWTAAMTDHNAFRKD